ncbi:MAG: hypothetical protein J5I90_10995 [Caldilineales bacterium]|nr:hypothetical protein [Caldilineales bacterium]
MMPLRYLWSLLLLAGLLAGCTIPHPICDLDLVHYPDGAQLDGGPLRLGVIDASRQFPFDLPEPLRQSGAALAVLDDVRWGVIEAQPPQDGVHTYDWDAEAVLLDTRVEAYQRAGFDLVVVLRAWNPWARAVAPQGGQAAVAASTPPAAEYAADYASWVQALAERYDADGLDDALLVDVDGDGAPDPVRYFQIESHAADGVGWQGTTAEAATQEYLDLLAAAADAIHTANPDAKIILAGPPALDLLDSFPDAAGLQDVVRNIDPAVCGGILAFHQMMSSTDTYDIVAVQSVADYTGLQTLAQWTATLAGRPVPVWITGATSAPALTGDPQSFQVNPLYPGQGEALWSSLQNGFDPAHTQVETWYRAEQARLSFKKWVYAAANGFSALVIGYEQDRPAWENAALGQRDLAFQGLLDPADGFSPPDQRPVIPALALAQAQLGGYGSVERLTGLGEGVEAFRFVVEGLPVFALWYNDGIAQEPEDAPVSITVKLPLRAPQVTLLTIPTERGQPGPTVQIVNPVDGVLTLALSKTPVVIRGELATLYLPSQLR